MRILASIAAAVLVAVGSAPAANLALWQGEMDVTNFSAYVALQSYRINGAFADRSIQGFDGTMISTGDLVFVETEDGSADVYAVTNIVASGYVNLSLDVSCVNPGGTSTLGMAAGVAAVCTLSTNNAFFAQQPSLTGARISEHMANAIRNYNFRRISEGGAGGLTEDQIKALDPLMTNSTDVAIGTSANALTFGTSVGYLSDGSQVGAVIGRQGLGRQYGAAVGGSAHGHDWGAAVGHAANGSRYGVAVGYHANGNNHGVGVGAYSSAASNSVAIGFGVTNTQANSTMIKGDLLMQGAVVSNAGAVYATNGAFEGTLTVGGNAVLTNETYVGTITGATIAAGSSDSVVVTGPNAVFTWNTNAVGGGGAGTITNILSTDGSVSIANPGGPQPDFSVASFVQTNFNSNSVYKLTEAEVSMQKETFTTYNFYNTDLGWSLDFVPDILAFRVRRQYAGVVDHLVGYAFQGGTNVGLGGITTSGVFIINDNPVDSRVDGPAKMAVGIGCLPLARYGGGRLQVVGAADVSGGLRIGGSLYGTGIQIGSATMDESGYGAAYAPTSSASIGRGAWTTNDAVALGDGVSNTIPNSTLVKGTLYTTNGLELSGGPLNMSGQSITNALTMQATTGAFTRIAATTLAGNLNAGAQNITNATNVSAHSVTMTGGNLNGGGGSISNVTDVIGSGIVAGNTPGWSLGVGTAKVMTNEFSTICGFNTVIYSNNVVFDLGNYAVAPQVPGWYIVTANPKFLGPSASVTREGYVQINGPGADPTAEMYSKATGANWYRPCVATIQYFGGSDNVSVHCYQSFGNDITNVVDANQVFSGRFIGK